MEKLRVAQEDIINQLKESEEKRNKFQPPNLIELDDGKIRLKMSNNNSK